MSVDKPQPANEGEEKDGITRREFLTRAASGIPLAAGLLAVARKVKAETTQKNPHVEYLHEGNTRIVRTEVILSEMGNEGDLAHSAVYKTFIKNLEAEIKNEETSVTLTGFSTRVRKEGQRFFIEYRVEVNPAKIPQDAHKFVAMHGTVRYGPNAIVRVKRENEEKNAGWEDRLKTTFPQYSFSFQRAESGDDNTVYHEALLCIGTMKGVIP